LQEDRAGVRLKVHLTPRSARDVIGGVYGDALRIRVKAPPVSGRANQAMLKLLARHLGVSRDKITIISGTTSRTKILRIKDLPLIEARDRLNRD